MRISYSKAAQRLVAQVGEVGEHVAQDLAGGELAGSAVAPARCPEADLPPRAPAQLAQRVGLGAQQQVARARAQAEAREVGDRVIERVEREQQIGDHGALLDRVGEGGRPQGLAADRAVDVGQAEQDQLALIAARAPAWTAPASSSRRAVLRGVAVTQLPLELAFEQREHLGEALDDQRELLIGAREGGRQQHLVARVAVARGRCRGDQQVVIERDAFDPGGHVQALGASSIRRPAGRPVRRRAGTRGRGPRARPGARRGPPAAAPQARAALAHVLDELALLELIEHGQTDGARQRRPIPCVAVFEVARAVAIAS